MDSPKAVAHVSLCAGYGGIDLGLKRAVRDLRTVAFSEIEGFACANLVAKIEAGQLDAAPIWSDLKTFPWSEFCDRVDILSGGYPCQPFSAAGKRRGKDDPRHLWPWIADGIRIMRPRVCFFENVEGHISLGLREVVEELASIGYTTTWGIFSAAEVGAPHQRKRVFILAHSKCAGLEGLRRFAGQSSRAQFRDCGALRWPSRPGQLQHGWEPPRVVGNTEGGKDDRRESGDLGCAAGEGRRGDDAIDCSGEGVGDTTDAGLSQRRLGTVHESRAIQELERSDSVMGDTEKHDGRNLQQRHSAFRFEQSSWRQAQFAVGGNIDGSSGGLDYAELCVTCDNRTDELRLLGNGVVPATAELAFKTLMAQLNAADS
jgi:DNA (cytosine-5)-methyltransferase 1